MTFHFCRRWAFVVRCLVVVFATATTVAMDPNHAVAQAPATDGTAASRLRLIAEEPQPTVTTRTTAPYPVTSPAASSVNAEGPPPTPSPAGVPGVMPPRRNVDPTVPDAAIRQFIDEPRNDAAAPAPAFPEIRLRARIVAEGKPATALIEIGGPASRTQSAPMADTPNLGGQRRTQAYRPPAAQPSGVFRTIREGDEFVLPQGDAASPIRVVKLTKDEVIIELVNRKTLIRLD